MKLDESLNKQKGIESEYKQTLQEYHKIRQDYKNYRPSHKSESDGGHERLLSLLRHYQQ